MIIKKIALFTLVFLSLLCGWFVFHKYAPEKDLYVSTSGNLNTRVNLEVSQNLEEVAFVVKELEKVGVKEAEIFVKPEEQVTIEKQERKIDVRSSVEQEAFEKPKEQEIFVKLEEQVTIAKQEKKVAIKPSILFLDPRYNHALVQDNDSKKWVVNGVFTSNFEFSAFNDNGCNICLSKYLFGDFKIMDIFLLSKLSFDNKLYIEDVDLPVNISQLLKNTKQDQYLAYVAPFNVEIGAENYEQRFDFGAVYRFALDKKEKIICSLGFNIPIERRLHIMSLDLIGLDMTKCGFTQEQINFVLDDFHSNYIDFMDFFNRIVLQPKGLSFIERQQKLGLGDMSFFAAFDFNRLTKHVDGLQLGLDLTAPTAGCKGKFKGCDAWEVVLGNGGAWQFGISSNILFKTSRNWFNPSAFIAGKFSSESCGCKRVAMLKENNADTPVLAKDVPNLIAPVYQDHYVRKFAEHDSCVHDFADQAVKVKTKLGSTLLFSLGNYFYNVFRENFRLALFYDLMYKSRDSVCVCDKSLQKWQYDTCALEKFTNISAQQFSWHLAYTSKAGIEVNVGSKHVFSGKNCPQTNSVVAALIANF